MKLRFATALVVALAVVGVAQAEIIEQVLVKVNGEIFTKGDLEGRQVQALRQRGQNVDVNIDLGALTDVELRQMLDEITPQIIVDAVDEMLVVQRGKELGYRLADEQFTAAVEGIKTDNNITTDDELQAALRQEGLTMADLRRNFERTMIMQRVEQTEVFGRVGVTEPEARTYYDAHRDEFTTPASVTLREILLAAPADDRGINAAQDDALRERAEALRARIAGGESFEGLAAQVSEAPSRANAGLIGPLNASDLSDDLQRLLVSMQVGDVTAPLRTPRGYQLLKLENRTDAVTLPFDQAREQIDNQVFTDKRRIEFQKFLERLRTQAFIEWKSDDARRAFDVGVKQYEETGQ